MDLLARFVGIWMVFVIYIAVGVEGVAYGVACSGTGAGDCTETTNIVCDTTCKCANGFFRLTSSEACSAQIPNLGDTCVVAEVDPDQCAIAGSECDDDGSTEQCRCKDTHYTDSTACQTKILLNAACTVSPAGQCADSLAACDSTALLCKCTSGNFENKNGDCAAQKSGLTTACDETDPATDQCDVPDSECRLDSGAGACLCKATHYTDSSACTIRKKPDEACDANQCVEHATCDTVSTPTKCECNAGYTATPTTSPTMCSGVVKFASLSYMYMVPILVSMMSLLR